jgi:hypothetical protein
MRDAARDADPARDAGIRREFEHMIMRWRWMGSPLFAEISRHAAGDEDLIALASRSLGLQPGVTMLFAAVHWLILKDSTPALARYFASVTAEPREDAEGAYRAFRAFCLERREEITAIMQQRTLQLTFAGRAGFIMPLINHVAQLAGLPLSLLEIGCSAGLLTLFDQYAYDFGAAGKVGSSDKLTITSLRFVGTPPSLPADVPQIHQRVGIDLNPVNALDPAERLWIDALIPPDMTEERRQIRAALDLRARTALPIVKGDALIVVPQYLEKMPDPICILAAHCLYQWPKEAREALDLQLRRASRARTLYFIRIDHPLALDRTRARPATLPGDTAPAEAIAPMEHEAVLLTYRNGEAVETLLARYDGYGRRAMWLLH